ncbi:hypothetical protein Tco_1494662, partial [Tanacetum coccineum]
MTFEHLTKEVLVEVLAKRTPLNGSKNYQAWVLLDIEAQRCCEDNSKLCTMQGTIYGQEGNGEGRNSSRKRIAIQPLGIQHSRTPNKDPGRFKVSGDSSRALYEIGKVNLLTTINGKHAEKFAWEYIIC